MSEILESIGVTEEIESRIKDIWISKGLSLSIPFIDLQHIWLILLIVELELYQKDDAKEPEFHRTALELINYTADHFSLEENLFVRFSYPKLLPHKRQHHSFIELIKSK
ncbi:MAG TPA: hemerythrin domain-containing protein, partial [Leptospiraceae bacterium]|nr:hemerythrin domain-containing protein [Leptospiraceae bacterium]